jgi:adenylyltransferase/sulfurtransferase
VIGPAVSLISSVAAAEALKLIIGRGVLNAGLLYMDPWTHEYELLGAMVRNPECPVCGSLKFDHLEARVGAVSSTLCGRNAVQVSLRGGAGVNLARLEQQLRAIGSRVHRNEFLLRATAGDYVFTIFPDNRAIIQGTDDEDLAKSLYARYVGV